MNRRQPERRRVPVSRRFRLAYLAATVVFVALTLGFAAAQLWFVAAACLLMAGTMAGVSRQLVDPGAKRRRPRYEGRTDARD